MAEPDDTITAESPILWWTLGEVSGTVATNTGSGGSGFDGTASSDGFGSATFLPASIDTAFDCAGVRYIESDAGWPINGDPWTFQLFFEFTAPLAGPETLISIGNGNAAGTTARFTFRLLPLDDDNASLAMTIYDETDTLVIPETPFAVVSSGAHMVRGAWDGTTGGYGLDGEPNACTPQWNPIGLDLPYPDLIPLTIGAFPDGSSIFSGRISHFSVYDTLADTWAIFDSSGLTLGGPPIVAPAIAALTPDSHWVMNESTSPFIDSGPQGLDLADVFGVPCSTSILNYQAPIPAAPGDRGFYTSSSRWEASAAPIDGDSVSFTVSTEPGGTVIFEQVNGLEILRVSQNGDELQIEAADSAGNLDFAALIAGHTAAVGHLATVVLTPTTWTVWVDHYAPVTGARTIGVAFNPVGATFSVANDASDTFAYGGVMANLAIWNSVLPDVDVEALHALIFPPPPIELDLASFDGYTPIIGPSEIFVGTPDPQPIDLASFDGYTPVAGISVLNENPTPDPFEPLMYARLFNAAGVKISDLATQSGVRFQDVFDDVGTGGLTLQLDDADAGLVQIGTEVRCYMFGQPVFSFPILQQPTINLWGDGEEAAQTMSITGAGRAKLLDKAKVYPPQGLDAAINAQHRLYTFASVDFPNAGTWGNALEIIRSGNLDPGARKVPIEYTTVVSGEIEVVETVWVPAPNGWPVPDAYWIWGQLDTSVVGKNFFRKTFHITSTRTVAIMATADNYFTLYLDGTPLLGETDIEGNWKDYKRVDIKLEAGWHTFGCIGVNAPIAPGYENPSAILAAICDIDVESKPILPAIIQTDSSWQALPYPNPEPGWTPGQIMLDAITEAQARGALAGFAVDFTAFNDSLGNPWPFLEGYSVAIGSSVLDMLKGLVDQGHVDWRVKPGGKLLQMFNQTAIGINSGVTYEVTGDIETQMLVSQRFVPQSEILNRFLVKWSEGYFEINDNASQAAWGDYEGFLSIDAPSKPDALAQAQVVINDTANPVYAVVMQVDPLGEDTSPYGAYGPGERVRARNPAGGLTWYQVQSITVAQTESSRPTIALELNARLSQSQREDFELLQGIGRAIVGDSKYRNTKMSFNKGSSV